MRVWGQTGGRFLTRAQAGLHEARLCTRNRRSNPAACTHQALPVRLVHIPHGTAARGRAVADDVLPQQRQASPANPIGPNHTRVNTTHPWVHPAEGVCSAADIRGHSDWCPGPVPGHRVSPSLPRTKSVSDCSLRAPLACAPILCCVRLEPTAETVRLLPASGALQRCKHDRSTPSWVNGQRLRSTLPPRTRPPPRILCRARAQLSARQRCRTGLPAYAPFELVPYRGSPHFAFLTRSFSVTYSSTCRFPSWPASFSWTIHQKIDSL